MSEQNTLTQPTKGNRSIRTEAQLLVLAKAREKALTIRKFNASVKQAEKGIENIEISKTKNDILAKHKKLLEPEIVISEPVCVPVSTANVEDEEPEIILIKKKKKPKKQKIIYYTDSDDEEEDPPPILIKKKTNVPVPISISTEVPMVPKKKFKNPLKY